MARVRWTDPNTGKVVGYTTVVNGKAVSDTLAAEILADTAVVQPGNPKRRLTPADGDEWLVALASQGSGQTVSAAVEVS